MSGPDEREYSERMAKAQATLDELRGKREARDEAHRRLRKLETAEREAKNETAIAAALEEHGPIGQKIAVIDTDLGAIIVKRPNPLVFKRFQSAGSVKWDDLEKLVRPCVVYPDKGALDTILEDLPATLTRVADAVVTLAGARAQEVSGK